MSVDGVVLNFELNQSSHRRDFNESLFAQKCEPSSEDCGNRKILTIHKVVPGLFIYFEEFNHWKNEPKAFEEFLHRSRFVFELFGATRTL
jgi:hypothetical protein